MLAELLTLERTEPMHELLGVCPAGTHLCTQGQFTPNTAVKYTLTRLAAALARGGFAKTYVCQGQFVGICVASPDEWATRELATRTFRIEFLAALGNQEDQLRIKRMLLREIGRDLTRTTCTVAQVPYNDLTGINALESCGFTATQTSLVLSRSLDDVLPRTQTTTYTVATASPYDLDVIDDATLSVPDNLFGWDGCLPHAERGRIHRDWLRTYARDRSLLLAYDNGHPVGLLAEHKRKDMSRLLGYSVGSIDLVATAPNYQHNGVAAELVRSTLETFRSQGIGAVELIVRTADTSSAGYYQNEGFRTIGSRLTLTNWRR